MPQMRQPNRIALDGHNGHIRRLKLVLPTLHGQPQPTQNLLTLTRIVNDARRHLHRRHLTRNHAPAICSLCDAVHSKVILARLKVLSRAI